MSPDLLKQPIKKALLNMAAPTAVGMLMTFLFQLVDTYFVGKLGTKELAAISFAYPVYFIVVSLFMGISSGVSSTVGKALGEKDTLKTQSLVLVSLGLMMAITGILGAIGYYSEDEVFSLLGASKGMIPLIGTYMMPLYLGMFALVGTLIGNAAIMAKGKIIPATVVMGIGGLINLGLDYVLIFGFGPIAAMGLKGAAIATIISWFITLILMTSLLFKEKLLSLKNYGTLNELRTYAIEILTIGAPAVAAQILNPLAIAILTRTVATFGTGAVAAYGIATRIESLALTGILALSVVITPIVAQNFGAKQNQRLNQVVAISGRMTVYWGVLICSTLIIFSGWITSIFTSDPEVIQIAQNYFYIVGLSFAGFGLTLITTSFFNGVYEPKLSLKITLVKSLVFTIPFALIGSFFSLQAIWIGIAIANILGAIYAGKILNKWLILNDPSLPKHNPIGDYISDFRKIKNYFTGRRK